MAGLPDLTTKLRSTTQRYEEVVFKEEIEHAVTRMISLIIETHEKVLASGAKAVFCPIIPMKISLWNLTRLQQKKTKTLDFESDYPLMQSNLHFAVTRINQFIVTLNAGQHMSTPFIDSNLISSLTRKPPLFLPRYRFCYSQFPDGCHINEKIAQKWAVILVQAMLANQG